MGIDQETYEESEMLQLLRQMDSNCTGDAWRKTVLLRLESRLIFVAECLASAPPYPEHAPAESLLVLGDEKAVFTWMPIKKGLSIGSGTSNALVISNAETSRSHAYLGRGKNGLMRVEDRNSTNGTFVNGHKVMSAVLVDGDILTFGTTHVIYFNTPPECSKY